MKLLFLHGWGFDVAMWEALRAALAPIETIGWDRGYFGAPLAPAVDGPFIAIGHSLGSLLLAVDPPPGCAGLIVINGFDRFTGAGRVAPRLLDRMLSRFAMAPSEVLDDFRMRAGGGPHAGPIVAERLAADLQRLADLDGRGTPSPRLVLQGGDDPILPDTMRAQVFAGCPAMTLPGAGHMLPVSHPSWCADRIREVLA